MINNNQTNGYIYVIDTDRFIQSNNYNVKIKKTKVDLGERFRFNVNDYDNLKQNFCKDLSKYTTKNLFTIKLHDFNKVVRQFSELPDNFKGGNEQRQNDSDAKIIIDTSNNQKHKLMKEYYRNQMMQSIIMLERNHIYNLELERFLLTSINETLIDKNLSTLSPDPVTSSNFDYEYMKSLFNKHKTFDEQTINQIITKIKSIIDDFNTMTTYPLLPYGYDELNDIYYCGNYQKALIPIVKKSLIWKLNQNGYTGTDIQTEIILTSLLRYESIINLYEQWALPYNFYNHLVNISYNLEAMASPFNSQMLIVDYVNKTNKTRFCSLFPDVDAPFGSIGNFFTTDII